MNIQEDLDQNKPVEEKPERHTKFYIALLLCISAVSIAGWSTYKTVKEFVTPQKSSSPRISRSKEKENLKKTSKSNILEKEDCINQQPENKTAIPYDKKENNASVKIDSNEEKTSNIEETEKIQEVWNQTSSLENSPEIIYPVKNEVTKEFSGENPVYSKTLGDWRTHEGTDFKAEKDSPVKAITNGVVTDIYEDASYGTTIVISHDTSGFTAYYAGLSEKVLAKKGQKVKSGDEIGYIGNVPCESLDGTSHLHLSINKAGKFIDPLLILDKEN